MDKFLKMRSKFLKGGYKQKIEGGPIRNFEIGTKIFDISFLCVICIFANRN